MEAWTQGKLTHIKVGSCKHKPDNSVANDSSFVDIRQQERSLMKAVDNCEAHLCCYRGKLWQLQVL